MDVRFLRFLGLHRLQPIHAHLVWKLAGGDAIFPRSKYRIMVDAEHAPGYWAVLRAVRYSAFALDKKTAAPALLCRRLDRVHADARHVHRRLAFLAWDRRPPQHLGFCFTGRDRRNTRIRLSANRGQGFAFPGARPAPDRIVKIDQLKWLTPNQFANLP